VNRRIYLIRLFHLTLFTVVVAHNDVTMAGRAHHKTRRCHCLDENVNPTKFDLLQESCKTCTTLLF